MKKVDPKKYKGPNGNRRRIRVLTKKLEPLYGPFKPIRKLDPVDELILTVLSQNTNDINRDRAWRSLKENFPTWQDVLDAPVKRIENAIRTGGLANSKSKYIKNILSHMKSQGGGFNLDHLKHAPLDEAMAELTGLPGVGIKTAACVMLFSFERPVMPVDTHVGRLSRRLGLVTSKASADQTFYVLMALTPDDLIYSFHVYLIRHGRNVCKSQKPKCEECGIQRLCPRRTQESPRAN